MTMMPFNSQTLAIADNGHVEHLTYEALLADHQDGAIWGASVGFRAMQIAGRALSTTRLWDRQFLSVVSAHPGPGVRDAIEYVTGCVSRKRFHLRDPTHSAGCHANMEFRWWVCDSAQTVEIELRHGFVPSLFFDLLDRIGTDQEQRDDEAQLEVLKTTLTKQLWQASLEELFSLNLSFGLMSREMNPCTNSV